MANREVNLTRLINARYVPVTLTANGKVKAEHLGASFYLDWNEGGKRIRRAVGKNAAEALAQRLVQESRLNAKANGIAIVESAAPKLDLAAAVTVYLANINSNKKRSTGLAYARSLRHFQESCQKKYVEDIARGDMQEFAAFLRDDKELTPRSCWNCFNHTVIFLNTQKRSGIAERNDWPRFVEAEPEIYEPEDLEALFAACTPEERLYFEFFLMTGERDQEVMYTEWSDVDLRRHTVRVSAKPAREWTPKAYKARVIPIHPKLVAALSAVPNKSGLLFPNSAGHVQTEFLEHLKAAASRAKLNPDNFWLHKFRSTFLTRALRAGNDLKTVQRWAGHTTIASTMRYLRADDSPAVREKIAGMF